MSGYADDERFLRAARAALDAWLAARPPRTPSEGSEPAATLTEGSVADPTHGGAYVAPAPSPNVAPVPNGTEGGPEGGEMRPLTERYMLLAGKVSVGIAWAKWDTVLKRRGWAWDRVTGSAVQDLTTSAANVERQMLDVEGIRMGKVSG